MANNVKTEHRSLLFTYRGFNPAVPGELRPSERSLGEVLTRRRVTVSPRRWCLSHRLRRCGNASLRLQRTPYRAEGPIGDSIPRSGANYGGRIGDGPWED